MAVRVIRPWNRVVLALGDMRTPWRHEDAVLAAEIALRLAPDDSIVLVVAPDVGRAASMFGPDDPVEVVGPDVFSIEQLELDDLAVAPAHVLRDQPPRVGWRLGRALDELNVAAVAGPHRLSVSKGVTRRAISANLPIAPSVQR